MNYVKIGIQTWLIATKTGFYLNLVRIFTDNLGWWVGLLAFLWNPKSVHLMHKAGQRAVSWAAESTYPCPKSVRFVEETVPFLGDFNKNVLYTCHVFYVHCVSLCNIVIACLPRVRDTSGWNVAAEIIWWFPSVVPYMWCSSSLIKPRMIYFTYLH